MGTIKFEIDLPEFEKELSINLVIRRDGEVLCSTSSPSMGTNLIKEDNKNEEASRQVVSKSTEMKPKCSLNNTNKSRGGNLMNMEF